MTHVEHKHASNTLGHMSNMPHGLSDLFIYLLFASQVGGHFKDQHVMCHLEDIFGVLL